MLLILLSLGCAGDADREKPAPVNEWVSFNSGLERAAAEGKPVVVDFYADWCKWCKVMERETFADEAVSSYLAENFVSVKVNTEDPRTNLEYQGQAYSAADLARKFGIRGLPTLVYLDSRGELIMAVPGFVPAERFLPFLQYIESGCYKKRISFEEYRKNGDCD